MSDPWEFVRESRWARVSWRGENQQGRTRAIELDTSMSSQRCSSVGNVGRFKEVSRLRQPPNQWVQRRRMAGSTQRPSDAEFAANIHDFRRLVRTRDHEGLASALASPELFRHACDDERYLAIAMQGISVLAWDDPVLASEELHRFDVQRTRETDGSDACLAARTLIAAVEFAKLRKENDANLNVLAEFLQRHPVLPDDQELGPALRNDMSERPEVYLQLFDRMSECCYALPKWLLDLGGSFSEEGAVESLQPEQVHALSDAVLELRTELGKGYGRYGVGLAMLLAILVFPNVTGVVFALLVLLAYLALGEGKSYERVVRPRLARLAMEHGVGAKAVVSWILKLRRQAGRMGHFDVRISSDVALDPLAATYAASAKDELL